MNKAELYITARCPICDWAMPRFVFNGQLAIGCYNRDCVNFGMVFAAPTIQLELLGRVESINRGSLGFRRERPHSELPESLNRYLVLPTDGTNDQE